MPDKKISELTALSSLDTADEFAINDVSASTTKKITWSTIRTAIVNYLSGAISTVLTSNLTASKALISNASGKIAVSSVTDTELGYLSGVTSAIQTQIDALSALTIRKIISMSVSVETIAENLTDTVFSDYTLSAGELATNDHFIDIEWQGRFNKGTEVTNFQGYFGALQLFDIPGPVTTGNIGEYFIKIRVIRTGASAQRKYGFVTINDQTAGTSITYPILGGNGTVDLSGTVLIKLEADTGVTAGTHITAEDPKITKN